MEVLQSRLDKVEKTAALVAAATGATPNLDDPALRQRLKEARQVRARQQAREEKRWNGAMQGLAEQVAASADESKRLDLLLELAELEEAAGQWEAALEHRRELQAASPDEPHEIMDLATTLGKMGRVREIDELQRLAERALSDPDDKELLEHASRHIADCRVDAARSASVGAAQEVERPIDGYALWRLASATPVSRHSALYRFSSEDRTRGTPLGKSAGAELRHVTWHLTVLARVGPNAEGPLPWVERDYTPVSTWMDWEKGRCDILIKTYRPGVATGWLRELPLGSAVHLSQPMQTLDVPSLVPDSSALDEASLGHSGVLLLLAGTGIAVAASVLRHADPASCFRPPGRSRRPAAPPLKSPVRLIYACRRDDVLMAPEIAKWCSAGVGRARLQRCVLAVSPPAEGQPEPPFTAAEVAAGGEPAAGLAELAALDKVRLVEGRVTQELLRAELAPLQALGRCRVVVSGPASFNGALKAMLTSSGVPPDCITVLEA